MLLAKGSWIRGAFQQLVLHTVPPESFLLDFGCGTGTDALFYAQQGYRVLAYDNSPGMLAQLTAKAAEEIASGHIIAYSSDYTSFLASSPHESLLDAIVSNFAVLNHVRDLGPLFAAFAGYLAPRGWLIVSVLNPFYWDEIYRRGWWRPYLRSVLIAVAAPAHVG